MTTLAALNIFEISSIPSSEKELSVLYKQLAKKNHPDVFGGSHYHFIKLQEAYAILKKNLKVKKEYNPKKTIFKTAPKKENDDLLYKSDVFNQQFNFKISLIFFLCYLFNIKVYTKNNQYPYTEKVTFVKFKNKEYILSKLPKDKQKLQVFKYDNQVYRFKASHEGVFKLNNNLRFLFFK